MGMFIGVVIMNLVVAIMLWLFTGFHVYPIKNGLTTNEWSKVGNLAYHLERCKNFYTKWHSIKKKEQAFEPSPRTLEYYKVKGSLTLDEIEGKKKQSERDLEKL